MLNYGSMLWRPASLIPRPTPSLVITLDITMLTNAAFWDVTHLTNKGVFESQLFSLHLVLKFLPLRNVYFFLLFLVKNSNLSWNATCWLVLKEVVCSDARAKKKKRTVSQWNTYFNGVGMPDGSGLEPQILVWLWLLLHRPTQKQHEALYKLVKRLHSENMHRAMWLEARRHSVEKIQCIPCCFSRLSETICSCVNECETLK